MSRSVPSRSQPYLRSTLPPPTGNLATRDIRTKNHPQRAATGAALGYRAERSVALFAHFASRAWSNYLRQRGPRWGGTRRLRARCSPPTSTHAFLSTVALVMRSAPTAWALRAPTWWTGAGRALGAVPDGPGCPRGSSATGTGSQEPSAPRLGCPLPRRWGRGARSTRKCQGCAAQRAGRTAPSTTLTGAGAALGPDDGPDRGPRP